MPRMSDKPDQPGTTPAPDTDTPAKDPALDGPDNEYVRVKHPATGDHYSTTRALARIAGASLIPDHAAVDRYGKPLPRKPRTDLSKES